MCLLIAKPANTPIPVDIADIVEDAAMMNPQGFGIAFPNRSGIIEVKHTMRRKAIMPLIAQHLTDEAPALIHFRLATGGTVDTDNCHPFAVDGGVFAHNGILSHPQFKPTRKRSDTHVLAREARDVETLRLWLPTLTDKGNKFALLADHSQEIELHGDQFGEWSDGLWYSNSYWRGSMYTQTVCNAGPFGYGRNSADTLHPDDYEELQFAIEDLVNRFGQRSVAEMLDIVADNYIF